MLSVEDLAGLLGAGDGADLPDRTLSGYLWLCQRPPAGQAPHFRLSGQPGEMAGSFKCEFVNPAVAIARLAAHPQVISVPGTHWKVVSFTSSSQLPEHVLLIDWEFAALERDGAECKGSCVLDLDSNFERPSWDVTCLIGMFWSCSPAEIYSNLEECWQVMQFRVLSRVDDREFKLTDSVVFVLLQGISVQFWSTLLIPGQSYHLCHLKKTNLMKQRNSSPFPALRFTSKTKVFKLLSNVKSRFIEDVLSNRIHHHKVHQTVSFTGIVKKVYLKGVLELEDGSFVHYDFTSNHISVFPGIKVLLWHFHDFQMPITSQMVFIACRLSKIYSIDFQNLISRTIKAKKPAFVSYPNSFVSAVSFQLYKSLKLEFDKEFPVSSREWFQSSNHQPFEFISFVKLDPTISVKDDQRSIGRMQQYLNHKEKCLFFRIDKNAILRVCSCSKLSWNQSFQGKFFNIIEHSAEDVKSLHITNFDKSTANLNIFHSDSLVFLRSASNNSIHILQSSDVHAVRVGKLGSYEHIFCSFRSMLSQSSVEIEIYDSSEHSLPKTRAELKFKEVFKSYINFLKPRPDFTLIWKLAVVLESDVTYHFVEIVSFKRIDHAILWKNLSSECSLEINNDLIDKMLDHLQKFPRIQDDICLQGILQSSTLLANIPRNLRHISSPPNQILLLKLRDQCSECEAEVFILSKSQTYDTSFDASTLSGKMVKIFGLQKYFNKQDSTVFFIGNLDHSRCIVSSEAYRHRLSPVQRKKTDLVCEFAFLDPQSIVLKFNRILQLNVSVKKILFFKSYFHKGKWTCEGSYLVEDGSSEVVLVADGSMCFKWMRALVSLEFVNILQQKSIELIIKDSNLINCSPLEETEEVTRIFSFGSKISDEMIIHCRPHYPKRFLRHCKDSLQATGRLPLETKSLKIGANNFDVLSKPKVQFKLLDVDVIRDRHSIVTAANSLLDSIEV